LSTQSTNTLGKYQIIREIARSNDIVYEAIDPSINRRIALKELCIPPNVQGAQKRERIERFWREGKAAGRLSHPNIVTIYEVGKEGDRHFIAMEYLEGQTLRDVLQAGGPLSVQTATDYALQLCSALEYAHANGVVHRDIKPENVQILPGGHLKLTDFGIARLMGEPSITQDGQVFGTPSYMSPEQVAGKGIDSRSDIFSIGVLIYEMFAGKKPFTGDSVVTITYNIINMEAPPPPGAPPYVVSVIRKAMSKDPDMRYQSAADVAADLRDQKCSDIFLPDPSAASTYPSPFGGGPVGQPMPPPPQQQSVPITPYGTPFPSPTVGGGQAVPDPFAQGAPPQQPMAPPPPPRPMLSAETRNFLGVFLLVLGVAGMLVFAGWAISLAYSSYVTSQTSVMAAKYYEQGRKLHEKGDLGGALTQYENAVRVSPKSKAADGARDGIYHVWIAQCYAYANASNREGLGSVAPRMIDLRPNWPEGHYYLAVAKELGGDIKGAVAEYDQASLLAGNDENGYGSAARARRERLAGAPGTQTSPPEDTQPPPAPTIPPSGDNTGIPFAPPPQ